MATTGRSSWTQALSVCVIIMLVLLALTLDMKRRTVEAQLGQLSMKLDEVVGGGQTQNQAAAKEVVEKIRKHYAFPDGLEPTVATILDVDVLRKQNAFYDKAQNGNYLIVTTDRAILYDAEKDIILDVVPVQLEPVVSAQTSSVRGKNRPTP